MKRVRKSDKGITSNCHHLLDNYYVPLKLYKVDILNFTVQMRAVRVTDVT